MCSPLLQPPLGKSDPVWQCREGHWIICKTHTWSSCRKNTIMISSARSSFCDHAPLRVQQANPLFWDLNRPNIPVWHQLVQHHQCNSGQLSVTHVTHTTIKQMQQTHKQCRRRSTKKNVTMYVGSIAHQIYMNPMVVRFHIVWMVQKCN